MAEQPLLRIGGDHAGLEGVLGSRRRVAHPRRRQRSGHYVGADDRGPVERGPLHHSAHQVRGMGHGRLDSQSR
jgi:hypothetical protein